MSLPGTALDIIRTSEFADLLERARIAYREEREHECGLDRLLEESESLYSFIKNKQSEEVATSDEIKHLLRTAVEREWLQDDKAGLWLEENLWELVNSDLEYSVPWAEEIGVVGEILRLAPHPKVAFHIDLDANRVKRYDIFDRLSGNRTESEVREVRFVATGVSSSVFDEWCRDASKTLLTLSHLLDPQHLFSRFELFDYLAMPAAGTPPEEAALKREFREAIQKLSERRWKGVVQCLRLWLNRRRNLSADPMKQRLCNAIGLLAEAHHATHSAVSLVLYFAAIEAVVSADLDHRPGMKKSAKHPKKRLIAQRLAALLQPDSSHRELVESKVAELYEHRNAFVHGSSIDEPRVTRSVSRLAIGAFVAIMDWMYENDRDPSASEPLKQATWFAALDDACDNKTAMSGVHKMLQLYLPDDCRGE
ncbi:MAG: hypothetical protein AMXMBFR58_32750 [Phycisphaerae bacterium]